MVGEKEQFLYEARTYVLGTVDEPSANSFIEFINLVNTYDHIQENRTKDYLRKPIKLCLNSFGGSVYDCLAFLGAIEMSKTEVHAIGLGSIMSSALTIFVSCHHRTASKHATFMYHELSSSLEGKVQEQSSDLTESQRVQALHDKIIINRTKLSKKRLDEVKKKKDDWYFTAAEALKYGVTHEVV